MSLTSLLSDPQSPVRVYLDGVSPLLEASSGQGQGSRAAADALGLLKLSRSEMLSPPFPEVNAALIGTAFDFRARIELSGFDPRNSVAAAGVAHLPVVVPLIVNGEHRARILTEAFGIATVLLQERSSESDLDRASVLLAFCEQVARVGAKAFDGSLGVSCDAAHDGQSFAAQIDPLVLADIKSLLFHNEDQLDAWNDQFANGVRYEANPVFAGSALVGGADADWIIGSSLIDCKVTQHPTIPRLREFIRQLLGYVMLDSDDSLSLRHVGIWLPRQRKTYMWSLTQLLGGNPEELLPSLRQGFVNATGGSQLARNEPVSTARKQQLIADNPYTPYEMLEELARSEDIGLRWRVARNPVTPEATVRTLAKDSKVRVRESVAKNPAAPLDVLEALAKDRSVAVRRAVAEHPQAPVPVRKVLSKDPNDRVKWAARANEGVSGLEEEEAQTSAAILPTEPKHGVQIRQDRDESALDSRWFHGFLNHTTGMPRLPIPRASQEWAWRLKRPVEDADWIQAGLSDEVLADLFKEDRPSWVRERVSSWLPIEDAATRSMLLADPDPEVRWRALDRTSDIVDESLSALLSDLAADPKALLKFRTQGISPGYSWRRTPAEYKSETLSLIAGHPATPESALLPLISSTSTEVLEQLLENPALGDDGRAALIQKLQTHRSAEKRLLLTSASSIPETVLIDLASDAQVKVRIAVAEHPAVPRAALARLANDPKRPVRFATLANTAVPSDVASSLAEAMLLDEVDVNVLEVLNVVEFRDDLIVSARLVEKALDRLSESSVREPNIRLLVANDTRSSEQTLANLAENADISIRHSVARNPRTPATVLEKLAKDLEPNIRAMVARNPHSPVPVLMELSLDAADRVRDRVVENPSFPRSILSNLPPDASPSTPPTLVKTADAQVDLVREPESELNSSSHQRRPDRAALLEMIASTSADTRKRVAFYPEADADMLVMLGGDRRSAKVRSAVAGNPNAPAALLRSLADDKIEEVRQSVAFNGGAPAELLIDLAGRSIDLAILVAMNPDTPEDILAALTQDSSPLVRFVTKGSLEARSDRVSQKT